MQAKALVNTLAKTLKCTKEETQQTTLGDVAAERLVDTPVTCCWPVKFTGKLGDREDEALVDKVAAIETEEEQAAPVDSLGNVMANALLTTVSHTLQEVIADTLSYGLSDVAGPSQVDTVADRLTDAEAKTICQTLRDVQAGAFFEILADSVADLQAQKIATLSAMWRLSRSSTRWLTSYQMRRQRNLQTHWRCCQNSE